VDPDDPAKLRDAIKCLMSDRGLLAEFSRRARERALGYSIEKTSAAYMGLYAGMMGTNLDREKPEMNFSREGEAPL
jgi:glycosyltransferase involved in cell wall biosynthesis